MKWNPWTDKSKDIPFEAPNKGGVGDGEKKVSKELNTPVLGQNSPYDMKPILNGKPTPSDCKKLDTQNDFNTGVKGRNALRYIQNKHFHMFESLTKLSTNMLFSEEERGQLSSVADSSPDELTTTTLEKLNDICMMLHTKKKDILSTIPTIPFSTGLSTPFSITLDDYYTMCTKYGIAFPSQYSTYENAIHALLNMNHPYIDEPCKFMEELHSLTNIFTDITLILVDKTKGYMFVNDITRIQFYRITRGRPRFKILLHDSMNDVPKLSRKELVALCKTKGIKGCDKMNKAEMSKRLTEHSQISC